MIVLITTNQKYLEKLVLLYDDIDLKNKIINHIKINKITIITGIIGSNKTNIIANIIKNSSYKNSYLYINKDLDLVNKLKNEQDLINLLDIYTEKYTKANIVILENINSIIGAKLFIKKLYELDYKILIIGNDIKIAGIKEIEILPLSIKQVQGIQNELFDFNSILYYGTSIEIVFIKNNYLKSKFIELLKTDIIYKDIVKAYMLKSHNLYYYTITFLALYKDYLSQREINLKLNNYIKISIVTTNEYIEYSIQARLIKKMYAFDIKKNKILDSKAKYYFTDIGIRNAINSFNTNIITLKENLLYMELLNKGYSVVGGIIGNFNFSFIANKKEDNEINYFLHISESIDSNGVKKEVNRLEKINVDNLNGKIYKIILVDNIKNLKIKKTVYNNVEIIKFKEFVMNIV